MLLKRASWDNATSTTIDHFENTGVSIQLSSPRHRQCNETIAPKARIPFANAATLAASAAPVITMLVVLLPMFAERAASFQVTNIVSVITTHLDQYISTARTWKAKRESLRVHLLRRRRGGTADTKLHDLRSHEHCTNHRINHRDQAHVSQKSYSSDMLDTRTHLGAMDGHGGDSRTVFFPTIACVVSPDCWAGDSELQVMMDMGFSMKAHLVSRTCAHKRDKQGNKTSQMLCCEYPILSQISPIPESGCTQICHLWNGCMRYKRRVVGEIVTHFHMCLLREAPSFVKTPKKKRPLQCGPPHPRIFNLVVEMRTQVGK